MKEKLKMSQSQSPTKPPLLQPQMAINSRKVYYNQSPDTIEPVRGMPFYSKQNHDFDKDRITAQYLLKTKQLMDEY